MTLYIYCNENLPGTSTLPLLNVQIYRVSKTGCSKEKKKHIVIHCYHAIIIDHEAGR